METALYLLPALIRHWWMAGHITSQEFSLPLFSMFITDEPTDAAVSVILCRHSTIFPYRQAPSLIMFGRNRVLFKTHNRIGDEETTKVNNSSKYHIDLELANDRQRLCTSINL